MSTARRFGYAVVGMVAVVLVVTFWSRLDIPTKTPGGSITAGSTAGTRAAGEPLSPAAAYGPDDVVVTADGDRYQAPHVKLRSETLIVDQPVEARPSDGTVEVSAPTLRVLVGDDEAATRPDTGGRASTRTAGGGLVAFGASFDAETAAGPVEVGDEVTVRVTTGDGATYDVVGIGVADGRRYTH